VPKHPHSRHAVICCEQYFLGRVLIDEFGQNSYSATDVKRPFRHRA
jgi:hypothetical protein